jgi:hypothetical protein
VRRFGAEAVKDLPSILTHQVFQKHVTVEEGDLSQVLRQAVVEITLVYFASDISQDEKAKVSARAREIMAEKLDACAGVEAVEIGWSVENDFPVLSHDGDNGRVGSVFALFIGRSSIEAQGEARQGRRLAESLGEFYGVVDSVTRVVQCREFGGFKDEKHVHSVSL